MQHLHVTIIDNLYHSADILQICGAHCVELIELNELRFPWRSVGTTFQAAAICAGLPDAKSPRRDSCLWTQAGQSQDLN